MPLRSPPTTPHSDVNHSHLIYYGPLSDSPEQSIVTVPDFPTHLDKNVQTTGEEKPLVIVQNISIQILPNPLMSLQQKEPPDLPTLLQLRDLLQDPKLFTPMITHCDLHSPILDLYKFYQQTMSLKDYQEFETIKIPVQSKMICALYQLNILPFLKTLQKAPKEHRRKTFCTSCYHLRHFKRDCPFHHCPYCHLIWPHHDEDQCLNNPKYSGPTPIKQESLSPPPLQVPSPKTVKKPHFSPNRQNSNTSSSSNGISKRGHKGKKLEWKRFQDNINKSLVREFQEMDKKYDQELKNFSINADYQEQYDKEAYNNIDGEPSHSYEY